MAEASGAEYVLFAGTDAAPSFCGVRHRDVFELGIVVVEILHTPGHANNEVGAIQPAAEIAKIAREHNIPRAARREVA